MNLKKNKNKFFIQNFKTVKKNHHHQRLQNTDDQQVVILADVRLISLILSIDSRTIC